MLLDGCLIVPNGSCSFGLVLDKQGSNHPSALQPPSNTTGKKREYLIDLSKQLINLSYGNSSLTNNNSIHHKHLETMRFNLVKGAQSLPHTDMLRSSLLPNYFFFSLLIVIEKLNLHWLLRNGHCLKLLLFLFVVNL